jgi:hypothetical protein
MGMYTTVRVVEPADLVLVNDWFACTSGDEATYGYRDGAAPDTTFTLTELLAHHMNGLKFIGYLTPIEAEAATSMVYASLRSLLPSPGLSAPTSSFLFEKHSQHLRAWLNTFRVIMAHYPDLPHIRVHTWWRCSCHSRHTRVHVYLCGY